MNMPSVIGPETVVRGTVAGDEDLVVEGRVEGSINLAADLFVGPRGLVEASVDAESATIQGQVIGDIVASRSVVVEKSARVEGSITAPRVVIHEGAHVRGRVDMDVNIPDVLTKSLSR
jgi:cytoskeletal protein CcmA (bactofilin family)